MAEGFLQRATIESVFVPVDMSAAANAGDWISMENYKRAVFVLFGAAGTAGQDPVFTLEQATAAAGTGNKALTFTTIYSKVGTLTGVTAWTRTTQAAATSYTDAASAEAQKLIVVEVDASELDVNNGYKFVQLSIPDVGAASQLGCAFCILYEPRYPDSAIVSALS